ncbi:hypothetical protein CALCODRAFT_532955, partial [Calocera cornea HHB12733]
PAECQHNLRAATCRDTEQWSLLQASLSPLSTPTMSSPQSSLAQDAEIRILTYMLNRLASRKKVPSVVSRHDLLPAAEMEVFNDCRHLALLFERRSEIMAAMQCQRLEEHECPVFVMAANSQLSKLDDTYPLRHIVPAPAASVQRYLDLIRSPTLRWTDLALDDHQYYDLLLGLLVAPESARLRDSDIDQLIQLWGISHLRQRFENPTKLIGTTLPDFMNEFQSTMGGSLSLELPLASTVQVFVGAFVSHEIKRNPGLARLAHAIHLYETQGYARLTSTNGQAWLGLLVSFLAEAQVNTFGLCDLQKSEATIHDAAERHERSMLCLEALLSGTAAAAPAGTWKPRQVYQHIFGAAEFVHYCQLTELETVLSSDDPPASDLLEVQDMEDGEIHNNILEQPSEALGHSVSSDNDAWPVVRWMDQLLAWRSASRRLRLICKGRGTPPPVWFLIRLDSPEMFPATSRAPPPQERIKKYVSNLLNIASRESSGKVEMSRELKKRLTPSASDISLACHQHCETILLSLRIILKGPWRDIVCQDDCDHFDYRCQILRHLSKRPPSDVFLTALSVSPLYSCLAYPD